MTTTRVLEAADADIAYDVHGPLPTADGRPPLFMIGQPMDASGFRTLVSHFPDRTVVTYDPRDVGRSTLLAGELLVERLLGPLALAFGWPGRERVSDRCEGVEDSGPGFEGLSRVGQFVADDPLGVD